MVGRVPKKVPVPRANPLGTHRQPAGFPHSPSAPRIKPIKTRMYKKDALQEDPMAFANIGFGRTGETGES